MEVIKVVVHLECSFCKEEVAIDSREMGLFASQYESESIVVCSSPFNCPVCKELIEVSLFGLDTVGEEERNE